MDFVPDSLFGGSRFRILCIVDNYSKKCDALAVGKSLKGADVVDELERLKAFEGVIPERIQCDNGSEFISKEVDRWAYEHSVTLDFSALENPQIISMLSPSMETKKLVFVCTLVSFDGRCHAENNIVEV